MFCENIRSCQEWFAIERISFKWQKKKNIFALWVQKIVPKEAEHIRLFLILQYFWSINSTQLLFRSRQFLNSLVATRQIKRSAITNRTVQTNWPRGNKQEINQTEKKKKKIIIFCAISFWFKTKENNKRATTTSNVKVRRLILLYLILSSFFSVHSFHSFCVFFVISRVDGLKPEKKKEIKLSNMCYSCSPFVSEIVHIWLENGIEKKKKKSNNRKNCTRKPKIHIAEQ